MKKTKKGFTLVELIVTMAIIAILAAISVPVTLIYVNKANASKEMQEMDVSGAIQTIFNTTTNYPVDVSGTTTVENDKFATKLSGLDVPYEKLGKVEIAVSGSSDDWNVKLTLKGQEYGDKTDGSVIAIDLPNKYTNSQIFKGSTSVPTSTTTYVYYINKSSGVVTMGV